jgi:hypothetical protein
LQTAYRQWWGVLWRWQILLSSKLINKRFKKKGRCLSGQAAYGNPRTVHFVPASLVWSCGKNLL